MFRADIETAVKDALAALGVGEASFVVERPADMAHGDYSTNAAMVARVDADELANVLKGKLSFVERIEVAGTFVNFFLSRDAVVAEVHKAASDGEWGKNDLYAGKKIMVEYTDPNPFKEFHIGHLMGNVLGESLARLFVASGAHVERANYQGDVGVHVAKAIWGKMHPPAGGAQFSWGEAYVYGSNEYEAHKEEIDALNKTIYEKSDAHVNTLYDEGRTQSLAHFEQMYKKLGTKFDHYFFESETGPVGLQLVKAHPEVFEESEGAIVFKGEQYGLHTRVFVNSKGLPTYEAKELGLAEAKKEKGEYDLSITVTAREIQEYFKVVRVAAEKIFPDLEGRMVGWFHGFLKLTSGKMSSRLGNVITGELLLEDVTRAARGREDVAVGAIKYAILRQGSGRDIIFDPEKSLSLEGDSGPYLQYALVRARSLIKATKVAGIECWTSDVQHSKMSEKEFVLARILLHFPETLARAAKEMEPHFVTTYLTEVASAFNSWYANERVIVAGKVSSHVLDLVGAIEQTLAKGLQVLGIPTPEEM